MTIFISTLSTLKCIINIEVHKFVLVSSQHSYSNQLLCFIVEYHKNSYVGKVGYGLLHATLERWSKGSKCNAVSNSEQFQTSPIPLILLALPG